MNQRSFPGGAGITARMHAATVAILASLAVLPASAVGNERVGASRSDVDVPVVGTESAKQRTRDRR